MQKGFGWRTDASVKTMLGSEGGNRSPSKPVSDVVPIPMVEDPAKHHLDAIIK